MVTQLFFISITFFILNILKININKKIYVRLRAIIMTFILLRINLSSNSVFIGITLKAY